MNEVGRHVPPILNVLAQREAELDTRLEVLRERMARLGEELAEAEAESTRLAITRQTLIGLAEDAPASSDDLGDACPDYQTLLGAFEGDIPLRVKDLCQLLGLDTGANDLKRIRGRLKRLAARRVLVEHEPGLFSLARADSE